MSTGPRLRPELAGLPTYAPGRPPRLRTDGAPAYKLSSNENPYPPLPGVLDAVARAAGSMQRYPDLLATGLVQALSERLGVPAEHLATGTGSVGVLQQALQATSGPGDEVVFAWRSFEAYPIVVRVAGARPVAVPLAGGERHDLDAMAAAVGPRTRLVLLCSPNNPTGPALRRGELERFLDRVPPEVLVVLDEAYREFVRDPDVPDGLELCRERPNLAVLRTFSKAYGLAGLRVGYAVAHPPVAEALRKTAVPFGVSGVAQAAALASLDAEKELLERVEAVVSERARLHDALRAQGWTTPASEGNFVWLRLGERAVEFAAACEQAGAVVRPFPGEGVRITVGEPEANELVVDVARGFPR